MNAINVGGAVFYQFGKIKVVCIQIKTIIRGIVMNGVCYVRCVPHHFFWHTTCVDARSTNVLSFNHRNFFTIHGGTVGRTNTATTATDGNIIKMSGHKFSPKKVE